MEYTDAQILEVMRRLGIEQSDIWRAHSNQRSCDALKARASKAYKRLAHELHPDKTGGDEGKAALFQLATEVVQEIKGIVPSRNPRREKWAVRIKATITA